MHSQTHLDFIDTHRVRIRTALLGVKGAEFAALIADVGVVDVLVANVICSVAVHPLTNNIRHPTHCIEVGAFPKTHTILVAQTLMTHHLLVDVGKSSGFHKSQCHWSNPEPVYRQ